MVILVFSTCVWNSFTRLPVTAALSPSKPRDCFGTCRCQSPCMPEVLYIYAGTSYLFSIPLPSPPSDLTMDGQQSPPSGPSRVRALFERTPTGSGWGLQREMYTAHYTNTLPPATTTSDDPLPDNGIGPGTLLQALQATTSDPCLLGPYSCDDGDSPSEDFLPLPSRSSIASDDLRGLGYERFDDDSDDSAFDSDETETEEEHQDLGGDNALPEWFSSSESFPSQSGVSTASTSTSTSQDGTGSDASSPAAGLFMLPTQEQSEGYAVIWDLSPVHIPPPLPEPATRGEWDDAEINVSTTPTTEDSDAPGPTLASSHDLTPAPSDFEWTPCTSEEADEELTAFAIDLLRSNPLPDDEDPEAVPTWSDWLQNWVLAPELDDECQASGPAATSRIK
ncbi:hypothetical protein GY45DRAFT_1363139 [Cubamyces sp. BRFM 1775]|nr:hypothetical protein GY45DRAFT_1363139 [Cubamyces sp. BRFM 1775]